MNNVGEFLETIYDVIFKPKEAFQKFAQTPQILQACLVVFITTTLSLIAISAGSGGVSYRGGLIVLQLIGNFTTLFIMVAIWHLIAELMAGTGQVKSLLSVVGFSYFTQLLITPIYLIASFLSADIAATLILVATVVVVVWTFYLNFTGIKIVYQVTGAKAFLVMILPILAVAVILFLSFILLGTMFMSIFNGTIPVPPTL